jgi:hypothetical protein
VSKGIQQEIPNEFAGSSFYTFSRVRSTDTWEYMGVWEGLGALILLAPPHGRRDYSPHPSLDLSREFLPPKGARPKIKSTKATRPKIKHEKSKEKQKYQHAKIK